MVLKFIRDHAWKFPSRPPLTLKCGAKGVPEAFRNRIQGLAGAPGSMSPALIFES